MSVFLFIAGALMLAFGVTRLAMNHWALQTLVVHLIIATGSGLVTAAALVALAP